MKRGKSQSVTRDCSHIQFCDRKSKIDFEQLLTLYKVSAFWAQDRNLEDVKIAILNSDPVITVWDGDHLIGCARATSDGIYRATIWDVVVDPNYQGAGLGRKLVQTVLSHPHLNRVERVYLMTTHKQSFYEQIGFQTNDTTTMILYNSRGATPLPVSGLPPVTTEEPNTVAV